MSLTIDTNEQPQAAAPATRRPEVQQHQPIQQKGINVNRHEFQAAVPDYNPWDETMTSGQFGQAVIAADGDATFTRIVDVMTKALATSPEGNKYNVVPFGKETFPDLHYSVIAMVRNNKVPMDTGMNPHKFLTIQLLLVEATGEPVRNQPVDGGRRGRSYTISGTPEDAYNSYLVDFVHQQLFGMFPTAENIYNLDPVIIRKTATAEGVLTDASIRRMAQDAQTAVEVRSRQRVPGFRDFDYTKVGGRDITVPVTAQIQQNTKYDSQGMPTFSDASISVDVERGQNRDGQRGIPVPNGPNSVRPICTTDVMVELVNVDPALIRGNVRGPKSRDFDPQVAWAPRMVVTGLTQYHTRTPAGIYFALASLAELGANRRWAETFRPSIGGNGDNLRDIGVLNIEANLDNDPERFGPIYDTAKGVFSDRDMEDLLDQTVTPMPMFAVDCLTSGPNAWTTTLLVNMARGDEITRRDARDEMARSLRAATGGLIDKYIDLDTCDIVQEVGERFHTGYWIDDKLNLRDLRELDNYLAVASRCGRNHPELIQEWSATWLASDGNEEQRMAERLEILKGLSEGTVVVTGTGIRVGLETDVIEAFARALSEAGVPLISRSSGDGEHFRSHRATAQVTRASLYSGSGFGARERFGRDDRRGNRFSVSRN